MRELKFRAKIAEGLANAGQWIYWGISGSDMLDAIDPGTVGQFTGLLDSDNKEIFEGDIITVPFLAVPTEVRFYNGKWIYQTKKGNYYGVAWDLYPHIIDAGEAKINGKIIGNVYDNPELLEATYA